MITLCTRTRGKLAYLYLRVLSTFSNHGSLYCHLQHLSCSALEVLGFLPSVAWVVPTGALRTGRTSYCMRRCTWAGAWPTLAPVIIFSHSQNYSVRSLSSISGTCMDRCIRMCTKCAQRGCLRPLCAGHTKITRPYRRPKDLRAARATKCPDA